MDTETVRIVRSLYRGNPNSVAHRPSLPRRFLYACRWRMPKQPGSWPAPCTRCWTGRRSKSSPTFWKETRQYGRGCHPNPFLPPERRPAMVYGTRHTLRLHSRTASDIWNCGRSARHVGATMPHGTAPGRCPAVGAVAYVELPGCRRAPLDTRRGQLTVSLLPSTSTATWRRCRTRQR